MKREVKHEWGVVLKTDRDKWTGPLGGGWFYPDTGYPKRFTTRREARAAAAALTDKHRYPNQRYLWTFRAVRMRIIVEWE